MLKKSISTCFLLSWTLLFVFSQIIFFVFLEIPSLFSAVQAAKAQQLASGNSSNSPEPKFGKVAYGRLKRAPKLPSKPALQSSESSSDLSGSEESSSSGDEPENEQNNGKDEQSNVSILGGHGTEDDDNDIDINKTKSNASKTGDLCIEIKLGKDNEKSKTLLAASAFLKAASGSTGIKSPSTESTSGRSGTSDSSSWMRYYFSNLKYQESSFSYFVHFSGGTENELTVQTKIIKENGKKLPCVICSGTWPADNNI